MSVFASSLSQICRSIADLTVSELNDVEETEVVAMLGNPIDAVPSGSDSHRVNFFFYQFSPFEFAADALPGDIGYLRVHCLITPFGIEETAGAGEHDLRIIGEVIRVFQEQVVNHISLGSQEYHVQTIMNDMGIEQISQLWGTQGDVIYRPSLVYEMALAPIEPRETAIQSPLAGSLGLAVQSEIDADKPIVSAVAPTVPLSIIDSTMPSWQPRVCFVIDNSCHESLSYGLGTEPATFELWIAGGVGTSVVPQWDVWDSASGWQTQAPLAEQVIVEHTINPDLAADANTMTVALPVGIGAGQAALYVVRRYQRSGDDVEITVLSNPLLVSLYE